VGEFLSQLLCCKPRENRHISRRISRGSQIVQFDNLLYKISASPFNLSNCADPKTWAWGLKTPPGRIEKAKTSWCKFSWTLSSFFLLLRDPVVPKFLLCGSYQDETGLWLWWHRLRIILKRSCFRLDSQKRWQVIKVAVKMANFHLDKLSNNLESRKQARQNNGIVNSWSQPDLGPGSNLHR